MKIENGQNSHENGLGCSSSSCKNIKKKQKIFSIY